MSAQPPLDEFVSVVVPTYKEAENIKVLIPRLVRVLEKTARKWAVVVVDDNSPDGTSQVAKELAKQYPNITVITRPRKMGEGTARIEGFNRSLEMGATILLEMDADLSHPPEKIPEMVSKIKEGYDVVIGSRYVEGGSIYGWGPRRHLTSRIANLISRKLLGFKAHDVTSAFRAYRREVLSSIGLSEIKSSGYAYVEEILFRCVKKGYRVGEVPFIFFDRRRGESKLNLGEILEFIRAHARLFREKCRRL